jgi:hypothetical protein
MALASFLALLNILAGLRIARQAGVNLDAG